MTLKRSNNIEKFDRFQYRKFKDDAKHVYFILYTG